MRQKIQQKKSMAAAAFLSAAALLAACGGGSSCDASGNPPQTPPVAAAWQWNLPAGFSAPLFPVDNPMRQAKVELGRALFHDPRISGNAVVRQLPCAGQCFCR